jgi:hypothetical protein
MRQDMMASWEARVSELGLPLWRPSTRYLRPFWETKACIELMRMRREEKGGGGREGKGEGLH